MVIIHPHHKKRKPKKPTEAERKLRAEWDRIVNLHSKPLELGRKSRGALPNAGPPIAALLRAKPNHRQTPSYPSLPMGGGGTKPAIDPIAIEKYELSGRVGQLYSKGAPQYLTDEDLKEQRTGSHKRR